jgi:hypothetical protein
LERHYSVEIFIVNNCKIMWKSTHIYWHCNAALPPEFRIFTL